MRNEKSDLSSSVSSGLERGMIVRPRLRTTLQVRVSSDLLNGSSCLCRREDSSAIEVDQVLDAVPMYRRDQVEWFVLTAEAAALSLN